jgi:DnaJ family protein C protein 13
MTTHISHMQGLANGNAHAPGTPLSPREAPTASTSAAPARLPPRAPYSLLKGNWGALWDALGKDHFHAGLIWNEQCRVDLRQALEREEAGLRWGWG